MVRLLLLLVLPFRLLSLSSALLLLVLRVLMLLLLHRLMLWRLLLAAKLLVSPLELLLFPIVLVLPPMPLLLLLALLLLLPSIVVAPLLLQQFPLLLPAVAGALMLHVTLQRLRRDPGGPSGFTCWGSPPCVAACGAVGPGEELHCEESTKEVEPWGPPLVAPKAAHVPAPSDVAALVH